MDIYPINRSFAPVVAVRARKKPTHEATSMGLDVDKFGNSLLHIAVYQANLIEVMALVRATPVMLQAPNLAGNSPLHLAAMIESIEIYRFLAESGADTKAANHSGITPLKIAQESSKLKDIANDIERNQQTAKAADIQQMTVYDADTTRQSALNSKSHLARSQMMAALFRFMEKKEYERYLSDLRAGKLLIAV